MARIPILAVGRVPIQENLKVSSAYIDPFNDYGYTGIACFSLLISILSAYFWRRAAEVQRPTSLFHHGSMSDTHNLSRIYYSTILFLGSSSG